MSENELVILLRDETVRIIARYCKSEPRTSEQIINQVLKERKSTNREFYETIVADNLRKMENAGLIIFENGKWKTLDIANSILEKYYGG